MTTTQGTRKQTASRRSVSGRSASRRSASRRSAIGRAGEDIAAKIYQWEKDAVILARNVYYSRIGEIDIVAESADGTIIFVEVKTRSGSGFGGAEAVDQHKLNRLRRAAVRWLEGQPYCPKVRFDVVVIYVDGPLDPRTDEPVNYSVDIYEGVDDGAW